MFKNIIYASGGLLAGLAVFVLGIWPHLRPQGPDATETVVMAMAEHLFQESRFPVLVRRDNYMDGCGQAGGEGGVVLLTQKGQQAVTEFVYNSTLVCVHTYLSKQQAPADQKPAAVNSRTYQATFGNLPVQQYYDDRSLEFRFPDTQDDDMIAEAVGTFFRRVPRYFNARAEGGLSNMVGEFRSPQAAAQAFVQKIADKRPKDKLAINIPGGWFLILGLGLLAIAIPAAQAMWKRYRLNLSTEIRAEFAAAMPSADVTPTTHKPFGPDLLALERAVLDREEKAIRMVPLLQENIIQEAGTYAANLIFAEAQEAVKVAITRGASPRNAERMFLAGKLAELLEKKHGRIIERVEE